MIAVAGSMGRDTRPVVRTRDLFAQVEALRLEAAAVVAEAFDGVSGKRIDAAGVPGAGRHGISRAINGAETSALFRLAVLMLLLRRLGMGRERALLMLEWLRRVVDRLWPEEEVPEVGEALEADAMLDPADEALRFRASHGCHESAREFVRVRRLQVARSAVTVASVERWLATR